MIKRGPALASDSPVVAPFRHSERERPRRCGTARDAAIAQSRGPATGPLTARPF